MVRTYVTMTTIFFNPRVAMVMCSINNKAPLTVPYYIIDNMEYFIVLCKVHNKMFIILSVNFLVYKGSP